jgi:hypothetical protein
MSAAAVVAIVFVIIFIIGITVGYIVVIALSALRADRKAVQGEPGSTRRPRFPGILNDPAVREESDDEDTDRNPGASGIPGHWDSVTSDDRPRWPGDTDSGYRS